jgi:N utilization substance protein B
LYDDSVPVGVAVNEAVELAKQYGEDNGSAFVNGILGKIVNE